MKIQEPVDRLKRENIVGVNIQETKLLPHMRTPVIPEYKAINRADRKEGLRGGGHITYLKGTIIYKRGSTLATQGMEMTTARTWFNKKN